MPTANRTNEQVPFVLRMPAELRAELTVLAHRDDRSLSYVLRRLVQLGLQAERKRCTSDSVDGHP